MKSRFLIIFLLALSQLLTAQVISDPTGTPTPNTTGNTGFCYVAATPNWNPDITAQAKYCKVAYNPATGHLWLWQADKVAASNGAWVRYAMVSYQATAGAPTYTPTNVGEIVVNTAGNVYAWNATGSAWVQLGAGGAGLTDGDKGDVDVAGSGTILTVDTNAVNSIKIANGSVALVDLANEVTIAGYANNASDTLTGAFQKLILDANDGSIATRNNGVTTQRTVADGSIVLLTNSIYSTGATMAVPLASGSSFYHTINGATLAINSPTSLATGRMENVVRIALKNSHTASVTPTWGAAFMAGNGGVMPAIPLAVNDSFSLIFKVEFRNGSHRLVCQNDLGGGTATLRDRPVFNVARWNIYPGSAEDTDLAVLLDSVYAAGGGVIEFNEGTYRFDNLIRFRNDGNSLPAQPSIVVRGMGCYKRGAGGASPSGGTILDLRLSTTSDSARIITNGIGHLKFEDITFSAANASVSMPFIFTTNTTLTVRDCAFWGRIGGASARETAVKLGAKTTTFTATGSDDSPFQGYGTIIESNYFNNVERGVDGGTFCNSTTFSNNTFWNNCGGSIAIEFNDIAAAQNDVGNLISGNLIEMPGYTTGIRLKSCSRNTLSNNNFYDHISGSTNILLESDAVFNVIYEGFPGTPTTNINDLAASNNIYSSGTRVILRTGLETYSNHRHYTSGAQSTVNYNTANSHYYYSIANSSSGIQWHYYDATTDRALFKINFITSTRNDMTLTGSGENRLLSSGALRLHQAAATELWLGNSNKYYELSGVLNALGDAAGNIALGIGASGKIAWSGTNSSPGSAKDIALSRVASGTLHVENGSGTAANIRAAQYQFSTDRFISSGAGSPEGVVTANVGSVFLRQDGGVGTMLYQKTTGTGNTGWTATASGGTGDIINGGNTTGATVTVGTNDAQSLALETNNTPRVTFGATGRVVTNTVTDLLLVATDSTRLEGDNSFLELNTSFTKLTVGSTKVMEWNNTDLSFTQKIADNAIGSYILESTDGNDFITATTSTGAARLLLGSPETGAAVGTQGFQYSNYQTITAIGNFVATQSFISIALASTGSVNADITAAPDGSNFTFLSTKAVGSGVNTTINLTGATWASGVSPTLTPQQSVTAKLIAGVLYPI